MIGTHSLMYMAVVRTRCFMCLHPWRALTASARFTSSITETVEVQSEGKVRLITINRPEQRNAVDRHTASLLFEAFKEFNSDKSVHCAVLCGKGGNFCAGYDLKELASADQERGGGGVEEILQMNGDRPEMENFLAPMGPTHMMIEKPVIAAVSGYAVAGGLELALMCDLRVVELNAVFGVFSRRFGVPLIDGGTARLPALIGLSRALDMILTGRPVHAKEALEIGLANRIVDKGKSLEEALKLAEKLAEFPQNCLRTDRNSALRSASTNQFRMLLNLELKHGMKVLREESIPGAKRFAQGEGRGGKYD